MQKFAGFTLVELMITLTVLAVLVGFGIPAYLQFVESNRLVAATNDFLGDYGFARSEALRQPNVTMCATTDQATCNGASWSNGWIVISNGTVQKVHGALAGNITTVTDAAGILTLAFDALGRPTTVITSLQLTNTGTTENRLICFATTGRAAIRRDAADCT